MSGAVVIGISFDGMDAAKKKIRKALDAANSELDDLSKAAGSLQVYDGRLVQKAGALDSMRNRINGRITGLQQMNADIDYAVRRFKETDELCAQRMRAETFEIKKTLGLPRGGGIFGGIFGGLVSIVIMAEAAWNWVNKDNKKILYGLQAGFNKRGFSPGSGEAALIAGGIPTTGKFVYEGMKAVKGVSEGAEVTGNLPPWGYNGAPPAGWTGPWASNSQSSAPSTEGTSESVTLKDAEKISKEITAGFEGGLYAVSGNFDGAGLSIGYLQYNLGTGSLQPLLNSMANGKDTKAEFESIFNFDVKVNGVTKKGYEVVREMLKESKTEQIKWGNSISKPGSKYYLSEPWKTAFDKLARSNSFLNIEDTSPVTIGYYDKATKIMDSLGLKTVRGYALAFDISVNNGSISNKKYGSWDLIDAAMDGKGALLNPDDSRFSIKGLDPTSYEYAKKVTDKKVVTDLIKQLKDVSDPTLRKCYFAGAAAALQKGCSQDKNGNWICYSWDSWTRKIAILDGSGNVHGDSFSNSKLTDDHIE